MEVFIVGSVPRLNVIGSMTAKAAAAIIRDTKACDYDSSCLMG